MSPKMPQSVCVFRRIFVLVLLTCLLSVGGRSDGPQETLRGVFFNPYLGPGTAWWDWLRLYHQHEDEVNTHLSELVAETGINFLDIQVLIPHTLAAQAQAPADTAAAIEEWANMTTLGNLVRFLDVCSTMNVQVEIDLANNMWIPLSVDTAAHIGNSEWWPEPDDTPWTESAVWYTQIIEYVEAHVAHPESIALWDMFGNYQFGGAEPVLWNFVASDEVTSCTEQFVKHVWPKFVAAGSRPKGAPILLPILSNDPFWRSKTPADRLSGITNLKTWLVDDLGLPPDYWVMSTYAMSDPATDGFAYLQGIVDVLGEGSAAKIISTDFKGPGHDMSTSIVDKRGLTGTEQIQWNLDKVEAYGFAGWWMWAYMDSPPVERPTTCGIRQLDGAWRSDLTAALRDSGRVDGGHGSVSRVRATPD